MRSPTRALARVNVTGLLTMVVLLALWESLVRSGVADYQFLPAPSAVAGGTGRLLSSGELPRNVLHTLEVTLLGWVAAGVIGIGLGLLLGLSDAAWRYSMASIEVMRAIPPVSLVPVALLVFGFSIRMELTIIVFVSAWPVLVNTIDGVRNVGAELLDVARMLRLSRFTTIRKVILPGAMRSIVVGLRLAMSLSLVLAVVAEMIGNPSGLGNALIRAQQALRPEEMFAYVLTIGLLGVALNATFRLVSSRALPSLAGDPGNAT
jgi:ABC-type nitrate/sulfonate/bicarbonate transport system permease component